MANYFKEASLLVLSEKCYDNYFLDFNFLDVLCFKSTLSKALGLTIISGSVLVKLPQILKIINNKSGQGISLVGVFLELFALTATAAYSFVKQFPFSSWGESTFLALQTTTIAALVMLYSNNKTGSVAFLIGYLTLIAVLLNGLVPINVLWFLQSATVPVVFSGKMIQAKVNYVNKSTGQLSGVTCTLLMIGSLARIFTSIQETGDNTIILTYCVTAIANIIIVIQLLTYWDSDQSKKIE